MSNEVINNAVMWHPIECGILLTWFPVFVFTAIKFLPRREGPWMKIGDERKKETPIRLLQLGSSGKACALIIVCAILANEARGQSGAVEWRPDRPAASQDYEVRPLPPTGQAAPTTSAMEGQAGSFAPPNNGSSPENPYNPPAFASPPAVSSDPYSTPDTSQNVGQGGVPPPANTWDPYVIRPAPSQSTDKESSSTQSGSPGLGADRSPFRYRLMWEPTEPVQGQPTDFGMVENDFSFKFPMWVSGPDVISFSGGVCEDQFQTHAVLPDSGRAFPENLWNIRAGINYMRHFDNGWTGGATLSIGSACDRPFDSLRDMDVTALAFVRMPRGEHDAWTFSLMYAPMSQIPFPIPGVAYHWQPSDMLTWISEYHLR